MGKHLANSDSGHLNATTLLDARKFTPVETAHHLGVKEATLANWRSEGRGPLAVRIGRRIWYFADDLEAYLQEERKNAAEKTRPMVALPVHNRRPGIRRFDGLTGHRGEPKGRRAIRETPASTGSERPSG